MLVSGHESVGTVAVSSQGQLLPGAADDVVPDDGDKVFPVPLETGEQGGASFTITLLYPGGERPAHLHTVFNGMSVFRLKLDVGTMLNTSSPLTLEVGPTWASLDHGGAITDRISLPSGLPCPFLAQGSEVRVTVADHSPEDVRRAVVARILSEVNQRLGEKGVSPA
jgi:hypothetical protein